MADTGHFDFGDNLRPVDFNGWISNKTDSGPNSILFWLQYWMNTYKYLVNKSNDQVKFFSFDSLCNHPQRSLERLSEIIDVKNIEVLMKSVDHITTPKPHDVDIDGIDSGILSQAEDLFSELQGKENL
jgi:hypothetical protein